MPSYVKVGIGQGQRKRLLDEVRGVMRARRYAR